MPDRDEAEIPQGGDSYGLKGALPQNAQIPSVLEESVPILEVHAPNEALHTWKGFLLHIATIVIGLFIAVGLEQTVEFFHHRHLSEQLEEQMKEVFTGDLRTDASSLMKLGELRAYLLQLRTAIIGHLDGKQEPLAPAASDPRMASILVFPNLAPYDAAKENGTLAYLPTARLRIYNRVAFQREITSIVREHWFDGLAALAAFNERYTDSTGSLETGGVSVAPDLTKLSRVELGEYLSVVAALIKKTDLMVDRYRIFDRECQAILAGVPDEDALFRWIAAGRTKDSNSAGSTPK